MSSVPLGTFWDNAHNRDLSHLCLRFSPGQIQMFSFSSSVINTFFTAWIYLNLILVILICYESQDFRFISVVNIDTNLSYWYFTFWLYHLVYKLNNFGCELYEYADPVLVLEFSRSNLTLIRAIKIIPILYVHPSFLYNMEVYYLLDHKEV